LASSGFSRSDRSRRAFGCTPRASSPQKPPRLDTNELAHVVVFATEILSDAERVAECAKELQTAALHVLREQEDLAWHEGGELLGRLPQLERVVQRA
jgi:hypothetical protein